MIFANASRRILTRPRELPAARRIGDRDRREREAPNIEARSDDTEGQAVRLGDIVDVIGRDYGALLTRVRSFPQQFLHPFDDLRRLSHKLLGQGFQLLAAGWFYLQVKFFGLGQEFRIS
jgi:hypothetical protein